MYVASTTLAREVSIERGAHEADRLRGAREQVADVVRQPLQLVRSEPDLVVHNIVVRRTGRTLQTCGSM